jgi:hypothetical protein
MTRPSRILRWTLFAWLLLVWPADGAVEQLEKKGDAVARVRLDRDAIELSGSLVLTVSVEGKAPVEMEPIKTVTQSKAWIVTPKGAPQTEALPQGRMRWEQSFQLSPLKDNEVPLPLEPLRFRAAG